MRNSQIPVTIVLIAVCAVVFLVNFFTHQSLTYSDLFVFRPPIVSPVQMVSLFAYPFLNADFVTGVFACTWLGWIGGSLERSWGSGKYALFFFLISVASAIGLTLGCALLRKSALMVGGMWIPATSLTVAWATINPTQSLLFFGIVPIQARWIAIFEVGMIYFAYYASDPALGPFVLLGALAAFLTVKFGLMTGPVYRRNSGPDLRIISGGQGLRRPLDDAGIRFSLNPLDRYRAWQQRRKLAKLLQKSGFTDRDDDKRRR